MSLPTPVALVSAATRASVKGSQAPEGNGAEAMLRGRSLPTIALVTLAARSLAAPAVEILEAVASLPVHLSGGLREPIGFAQTASGEYIVLERLAHTVYAIDAKQTAIRKVLQIGFEEGRVLRPGALALAKDEIFAVADAPNGLERIQYFNLQGLLIGGFYLQTRLAPRVVAGSTVLNGVGSMHFTGRTFLVNKPESGALFQEIDRQGLVLRQIGTLRKTGFETSNSDVHLAMNIGMPLADPGGGFIFVFNTGVPMFRKYDAGGALLFERHIEGPELDGQIQSLPTEWRRRTTPDGAFPVVDPLVRAAAVDPTGRLWVSLTAPFTYVYDVAGEKTRTIQFRAAGVVSPTSLFFNHTGRILATPGCYEFRAQ